MAAKTFERLACGGRLSIGPTIEYRNGKRLEDILPTVPTLEICQIVGTHHPNEAMARVAAAETLNCVSAVWTVPTLFAIAHTNRRVADETPRCGQTLFKWRHAALRFKRILRRNQPPELIQIEPFDGLKANMKMAFMRRIERATKQADSRAACGRGSLQSHRAGTRYWAL